MSLAFSNIAWSPEEDDSAINLLASLGVHQIEAAPGRLWSDLLHTTPVMGEDTRANLAAQGVIVAGFQAILFGYADLQLFDDRSRPKLLSYLRRLADLCASVGGGYLVFGAPKNRWIPEEISDHEAIMIAADFFKELGGYAQEKGVVFGIEANPAPYGCNFCTTIKEVSSLVREINSPGVRWHLDTGEMAMNEERVPDVILDNADIIGSVHISEPNLRGFSTPWDGHSAVALALNQAGYSGVISIEMKKQPEGLKAVDQAVRAVSRLYGYYA
jgi:D-psicose/D-tagatose/L-ribulose 3-epimerase